MTTPPTLSEQRCREILAGMNMEMKSKNPKVHWSDVAVAAMQQAVKEAIK